MLHYGKYSRWFCLLYISPVSKTAGRTQQVCNKHLLNDGMKTIPECLLCVQDYSQCFTFIISFSHSNFIKQVLS